MQADEKLLSQARKRLQLASYYDQARAFARTVARYTAHQSDPEKRLFICTGGGPGIMEVSKPRRV